MAGLAGHPAIAVGGGRWPRLRNRQKGAGAGPGTRSSAASEMHLARARIGKNMSSTPDVMRRTKPRSRAPVSRMASLHHFNFRSINGRSSRYSRARRRQPGNGGRGAWPRSFQIASAGIPSVTSDVVDARATSLSFRKGLNVEGVGGFDPVRSAPWFGRSTVISNAAVLPQLPAQMS